MLYSPHVITFPLNIKNFLVKILLEKDNYVLDEEKLDVILSNLEHNLKTLFENDKDMLAEIINGVTGIPKEDIIERGILLDSQDIINPEKVKKYKDSDILISVYNNTINIVMNKKDQK